jgi:hypothetical protein
MLSSEFMLLSELKSSELREVLVRLAGPARSRRVVGSPTLSSSAPGIACFALLVPGDPGSFPVVSRKAPRTR